MSFTNAPNSQSLTSTCAAHEASLPCRPYATMNENGAKQQGSTAPSCVHMQMAMPVAVFLATTSGAAMRTLHSRPPPGPLLPHFLPICFLGEQWPGGSPGNGARSPGVRLCGLPQGPSKRLEGGLHNVVAVLARQLRTQTAKRGGQQAGHSRQHPAGRAQVTGQPQGKRGGDKGGRGRR